ncbi:MAG TPA: MATE family efflux transporter [Thioalkalivibrio sp.]|nr:MATE family efflux transporter [Thioalkalivibrio sp.]
MAFTPSYRRIWSVSYPLILAGISETVVEVTDAIFLARYGLTELAAIGLAGAIFAFATFLTLGLVDAIQIVIGRRVGEREPASVGRAFNQGLYLLALASLLMIGVILFVLPAFTREVLASVEVHLAVHDYLRIAAFGLLFNAINLAYSAFYVGISRTRVLIGATVVLAVTNILLDYLLIFGNFGLPEMGIAGAGVASLGAEIAAVLFITADVIRRRYTVSYGLLRFTRWDGAMARHLVGIGTPVSLDALVETARWFLFFLIIEQLGEQSLAIATIVYSCYAVFLIPVDAFSESVCSMVSNLIGQRRQGQLGLLIRRAMTLSLAGVVPVLLITGLAPEWVLSLFTPDEDLIEAALISLMVVMLATFIAVPAEAFNAAVAGTGDTWAALAIQVVISLTTLTVAAVAAFGLGLSLPWVWAAEVAGWLVCLIAAWTWFVSGAWRRLRI